MNSFLSILFDKKEPFEKINKNAPIVGKRAFVDGNKVLPFIINDKVVDIDSIEDLKYANYIFKSKK